LKNLPYGHDGPLLGFVRQLPYGSRGLWVIKAETQVGCGGDGIF